MATNPSALAAYKGQGVPRALARRNLATIVTKDDVWKGALRPGDPLQIWYEDGTGHNAFFHRYDFDSNGNINGLFVLVVYQTCWWLKIENIYY